MVRAICGPTRLVRYSFLQWGTVRFMRIGFPVFSKLCWTVMVEVAVPRATQFVCCMERHGHNMMAKNVHIQP